MQANSGQHPFYRVDPSALPAVGVKTFKTKADKAPNQLSLRQARLTRDHLDNQAKAFSRLRNARVFGNNLSDGPSQPPRGNQLTSRYDNRLRGIGAQRDTEIDQLINTIRRRTQSKGLRAATKLEQMFIDLDVDKNGVLSSEEFVKGLLENGVLETKEECNKIFAYFDDDASGCIDPKEFMNAMTGQLSPKRRAVVKEAFESIDVNHDGTISVEDLKLKYRSFAHPDVFCGARSEEDVFSEFLSYFDVISNDGTISLGEFEHYYEYLSSLTLSDLEFCIIVRNAWHLIGASGGRCLRVHITLGVGAQKVNRVVTSQITVEIRPDINCSVHDPRFFDVIRKRLAEMGYPDVESIEVLGRT